MLPPRRNADVAKAPSDSPVYWYCSSSLDALQLCLRRSAALAQSIIGSACRRGKVCVQSSVALGLQKKLKVFWIMIEFTNFVVKFQA